MLGLSLKILTKKFKYFFFTFLVKEVQRMGAGNTAEKSKLKSSRGHDNGELFDNRLIVRMRTLTPIWTGDIDQKSEHIQTLGIMGSLRWWTEAILRGIGKYACDPTDDEIKCPKEDKNNKKYCYACLIFGSTGIRRTFRLNTNGGESIFSEGLLNIKPSERRRGWYLGSGVVGEINLEITPLDKDFDESLILLPLIIASKWGGIGAKTQHGYGVVKIGNYSVVDFNRFVRAVEKIANQGRLSRLGIELRNESNDGLPNIKDMFFAKIRFSSAKEDWWKMVDGISTNDKIDSWVKSGSVPVAPAIKNWLRYNRGGVILWSANRNATIENWLFGTPRANASKINISCAYLVDSNSWELRIWGWIPNSNLPTGFNRDLFLEKLKGALEGIRFPIPWNRLLGSQTRDHKLEVWREFNSQRDTVKQEKDISSYLQSLLKGEG